MNGHSGGWGGGARRHRRVFVLSGCLVELAHINIKPLQDAENPLGKSLISYQD